MEIKRSQKIEADEGIDTACSRQNVLAVGWNIKRVDGKEASEMVIAARAKCKGIWLIRALAKLAETEIAIMAKGDVDAEIRLTANLMEALAEEQAKRMEPEMIRPAAAGSRDDQDKYAVLARMLDSVTNGGRKTR